MTNRVICTFCRGTGKWNKQGDECEACEGRGDYVSLPFGAPKIVNVLTDSDVNALAEYWCSHERGETLGEFIQRVAMRAQNTGEHK